MLVRMGLWRSGGGLEEGKLGEVEEEKEKGLRTDKRGSGRGRRGWGMGCGRGQGGLRRGEGGSRRKKRC